MKWIEIKMRELGVSTHDGYKVTAFLDNTAMVTVHSAERGMPSLQPFRCPSCWRYAMRLSWTASTSLGVHGPVDTWHPVMIARLPVPVYILFLSYRRYAGRLLLLVSHQNPVTLHRLECEVYPSFAGVFDCKPLPVLWARLPEYTADNTIMFDDLRRNYVFNPQNGLVIRPYK